MKPICFLLLSSLLIVGSLAQASCCSVNTINIIGAGSVSLTPDIASISITVSKNGTTTLEALSNLNIQVNQLLAIFKAQNIPAANYSTSSITLDQVYNYNTTPYKIIAQTASQTFSLTYGNVNGVTALLGLIGKVNVNIDSLSFGASNTTAALRQARIAAVADARTKFNQYLTLTSTRSQGVKQIIDLNSDQYTPFFSDVNSYKFSSLVRKPFKPNVQVSASVNVIWGAA
jgi:uncharacterized protein YggE